MGKKRSDKKDAHEKKKSKDHKQPKASKAKKWFMEEAVKTTGKKEKSKKIKNKDYEKELVKLQIELVKLQEWIKHEGLRVVVIFEGRDAAGKGGVIKRIAQSLSPRICRVAALPAPHRAREDLVVLPTLCCASPRRRRDGVV